MAATRRRPGSTWMIAAVVAPEDIRPPHSRNVSCAAKATARLTGEGSLTGTTEATIWAGFAVCAGFADWTGFPEGAGVTGMPAVVELALVATGDPGGDLAGASS